jgi:hypothetical protein
MIADIAFVFHWPLSEIEALPLDRLLIYRNLAADRWNRANNPKEG